MNYITSRIFRRIIEDMVKKYPNDMILGEKIRFYVKYVKEWQGDK